MTSTPRLHGALRAIAIVTPLLLAACGSPQAPTPAIASTPLAATHTPPPDYPLQLACAGMAGTTVLQVSVDASGTPNPVTVARSSGHAQLDELALAAVKGWTFQPATRGGQPVTQSLQVPVTFRAPAVRPDECFQFDASQ